MARPSSSPAHPYRLSTPPPRGWSSHQTLVTHGHRLRTRYVVDRVGTLQVTRSPEVPTEPESSPLRPGRHLHRTRRIPARYLDSIYSEVLPGPTLPEVPSAMLGREPVKNQILSPGTFLPKFFNPDMLIKATVFRSSHRCRGASYHGYPHWDRCFSHDESSGSVS